MKKKILILISIISIGCNKDETKEVTDMTALNLVTGANFRMSPEDTPLTCGNPNILINNTFVIYPNPAQVVVHISAQENVTDVWFVPANPEKIHQDVNFNNILNTNLYNEESIILNSNFSFSGQSSTNLSINIKTLEEGYYKLFVKIGGEIYWDNFYKTESSSKEHLEPILNFWD